MTELVFVDTNVLVYARDSGEPDKQPRAMEWRAWCWRSRAGRISFQILQEYYVTVTQKLHPGMTVAAARADVRRLLAWRPLAIETPILAEAWEIQDGYRLSW